MDKLCCICQRQCDTLESLNQHIRDEHPDIFREVSSNLPQPHLNDLAQSQVEDGQIGNTSSQLEEHEVSSTSFPEKELTVDLHREGFFGENEKDCQPKAKDDFASEAESSQQEISLNLTAMESEVQNLRSLEAEFKVSLKLAAMLSEAQNLRSVESEAQNYASGKHVQPQIDLREFGIHDAGQSPDSHTGTNEISGNDKFAPENEQVADENVGVSNQPSTHADGVGISANNTSLVTTEKDAILKVNVTMSVDESLPENTLELAGNVPKNKNTMEAVENLPKSSKFESANAESHIATTGVSVESLLVLNQVSDFDETSPRQVCILL